MKKILTALNLSLLSFLFTTPAHAVICNPILKNCVSSTAPKTYFNSALSAIISIFFIVGVVYYFWHFTMAGYHLIASDGDPKKWESGKNEMVWATVGLFVIFSIFAVLKFVGMVLGIPGLSTLTITWPTL